MQLRIKIVWMLTFVLTVFAMPATASDLPTDKTPAPEEDDHSAASATIERIIQTAVRNIARRYNLNEAQTKKTEELWNREVRKFLKEHENEVWPTLRRLLGQQAVGQPPGDPEEVKRLGKMARPLAQRIREAAFRANEEWRGYLTAEQRRLHDFDLAEMEKAFDRVDKNFESWEKGEPLKEGIFPKPPPPGTGPPTPPRPQGSELPPPKEKFIALSILDALVEEFIKEYELGEGQITAARSILMEFKGKANDFKNAKKEEFAKIDAARENAREQRDTEGIRRETARHKKLLEPFYVLVKQMDGRLKGLLTSTQIERHREGQESGASKPKMKEAKTETSPPKATAPTKGKLDTADSQAEKDKD